MSDLAKELEAAFAWTMAPGIECRYVLTEVKVRPLPPQGLTGIEVFRRADKSDPTNTSVVLVVPGETTVTLLTFKQGYDARILD